MIRCWGSRATPKMQPACCICSLGVDTRSQPRSVWCYPSQPRRQTRAPAPRRSSSVSCGITRSRRMQPAVSHSIKPARTLFRAALRAGTCVWKAIIRMSWDSRCRCWGTCCATTDLCKTEGLLLFLDCACARGGRCRAFFAFLHRTFEILDCIAQTLTQVAQLAGTEEKKRNHCNEKKFSPTKFSTKHLCAPAGNRAVLTFVS